VKLRKDDIEFIAEAIRGALTEVTLCDDISQGVEDDLIQALEILTEAEVGNNEKEEQEE